MIYSVEISVPTPKYTKHAILLREPESTCLTVLYKERTLHAAPKSKTRIKDTEQPLKSGYSQGQNFYVCFAIDRSTVRNPVSISITFIRDPWSAVGRIMD